jgi:hypothetical protein
MTPEISEFSYGFALTNEILGWSPVAAAPVFPSLIEEGKAGGGYDVKLDTPGVPLYLQFKRADCMMRRSAREIHLYDLPLSLPFYRFKITESDKSNQHELLLSLDERDSCLVFYAAPRFHELAEINHAWSNNLVATRSIFVAPSHIGSLDSESHHVAYDEQGAWLCSDPQPIDFTSSNALVERLRSHLNKDKRPLREKIHELVTQVESAERRVAERRVAERAAEQRAVSVPVVEPLTRPAIPTVPSIPIRPSRTLSEPEAQLRKISDIAARVFDTQLIIVQPAGS